jgi:hypothetical protein
MQPTLQKNIRLRDEYLHIASKRMTGRNEGSFLMQLHISDR